MSWRKNEDEVIRLLNLKEGYEIKKATGKYSAFDAYGWIEGKPTLIEIKLRERAWLKMWIERQKLLSLFNLTKETPKDVDVLLVVSTPEDHFVYDCKSIWTEGTHKSERMNDRTCFGQSNKVNKEVIEFNRSSYINKL